MKVYGLKNADMKDFIDYITKNREKSNLSDLFRHYAKKKGKAVGTIRNMYYKIVKTGKENEDFYRNVVEPANIKTIKFEYFSEKNERELIKKILEKKAEGRSVRRAVYELAKGDAKLSLRYQNKYRNAIKLKPKLIDEIKEELKKEGKIAPVSRASDLGGLDIARLQKEINGLVDRIALNIKRENLSLKQKLKEVTDENERLIKLIFGNEENIAKEFFGGGKKSDIIS